MPCCAAARRGLDAKGGAASPSFTTHRSPHLGNLRRVSLSIPMHELVLLFSGNLVGTGATPVEPDITAIKICSWKLADEIYCRKDAGMCSSLRIHIPGYTSDAPRAVSERRIRSPHFIRPRREAAQHSGLKHFPRRLKIT